MNNSKSMKFNRTLIALVMCVALVLLSLASLTLFRSINANIAYAAPTDNWTDTGNYDRSWYDGHESDTEFTLSTPEQFAGLAYLVNDRIKFNGKTIKLGADIDLNGHYWVPIGEFRGTFDGQDHTINNMTVSELDENSGLFGFVFGATIKNVKLASNCNVTGTGDNVGGIVSCAMGGSIENITNSGNVIGKNKVGGIVGYASGTTIKNVTYNGGEVIGENNVGGIIGYITSGEPIENATNVGKVTGMGENVGGIVGIDYNVPINSAINKGRITGTGESVGGIVGSALEGATIAGTTNSGDVTGSGNDVGGIVGNVYSVEIFNCRNVATISGAENVGGLVGGCVDEEEGGDALICNSYNVGNVIASASGQNLGGILGTVSEYSRAEIINSYNAGVITSTGYKGGIAGNNSGTLTLNNVYYLDNMDKAVGNGSYDGTATKMSEGDMKGAVNNNKSLAYKLNAYVASNATYMDGVGIEYVLKTWVVDNGGYPTFGDGGSESHGDGASASAISSTQSDNNNDNKGSGLSGGAIAAIVIGVAVVIGGGGFCLWYFILRKKK